MRRRRVVLTLLAFAVADMLPRCSRGRSEEGQSPSGVDRPPIAQQDARLQNVLIVVIDTLRFDATSLAPNGAGDSPFLARFARGSTHFSRTYSTNDSTIPSHFSLLTGVVSGWQTGIHDRQLALPYQLGKLGYVSFGVAANGVLSTRTMPLLLGFERFECVQERWLAMPESEKARLYPEIDARIARYRGRLNRWNRMMVFASARRVLRTAADDLSRARRPFLGFVNLIEPHDPYFPDPHFYDARRAEGILRGRAFDSDLRFRRIGPPLAGADPTRDPALAARLRATQGKPWALADDLSPEQLRVYRSRYEAEVREVDQALEEFFDRLERRKDFDETLVIVTADHGESFGEAGFLTHALSNQGDREATQRVPLLIRFPHGVGKDVREVPTSCTLADVAPTVYDVLGIDWAAATARTSVGNFGRSLLPLVTGSSQIAYSRKLSFDGPATVSPAERQAVEADTLDRLRSLGYVQ